MKTIEQKIILDRLSELNGAKLSGIFREHGNIWFEFEMEYDKTYVLMLQTFFRICRNGIILVTETDKYRDAAGREEFEWDIKGENAFDKWLEENEHEISGQHIIIKTEINNYGDLSVFFDNEMVLTVYSEVTNNVECWRFFEIDDDEKNVLIVNGNSVIYSDYNNGVDSNNEQ